MEALPIAFGDGSAREFAERDVVHGKIVKVVGLDDGTTRGNPSVGFFIELPDGKVVFTETTYRLFNMAAAAMRGRWGG